MSNMTYHLLTGATGLLGRYLMRDLLLAEIPLAVLVRSSRRMSAEKRVESAMATWEEKLGRDLPRPIVLEGDICEPMLGLDPWGLGWVTNHCEAVIHNAASLTFQATDGGSEPWRSNVQGTKNVLDLCQVAGIPDFHHVSTAYVCGLRQGVIRESELDVGQEFGNDYEQSKVQAEKLVRSAEHLSPPTIYRPAIIIGDSQTGFTTTFHGFYAALHLAHTLMNGNPEYFGTLNGNKAEHLTRLTLNGDESKNLVPVDWVAALITHVICDRKLHGQTYHLTPRRPVTTRIVRDVLEQANGFCSTEFFGAGAKLDAPTEVEQLFYEHIRIYNSYWRDDPTFDASNTLAAAPQLPCPEVDAEMLLRLSRTAIDMGFRWSETANRQPTEVRS
jgi:thioester reductase-like protein